MDTKMLCPTLSMMLVKTIKALCEINIHYDQKLEITGSLHVRSDGNKVLTCLLDEETVKGSHHETAARVAELAARLSLANAAAFTFQHVPLPSNTTSMNAATTGVSHPQQVAEALLSTMHGQVAANVANTNPEYGYFLTPTTPVVNTSTPMPIDSCSSSSTTMLRMSPISPAAVQDNGLSSWDIKRHSEDQLTACTQRQKNGDVEPVGVTMPTLTTPRKAGRRVDTVAKTLATIKASNNLAASRSDTNALVGYQTASSASTSQPLASPPPPNHIKLPDIQTLAQRLPNFQHTSLDIKPAVPAVGVASADVGIEAWPPATARPGDKQSPQPLELEASTDATAGIEIGTGGGKKKFQCMFCGIFLSTKCYLKNHINAVHTRSRIYQCDLCAHYFYSAGAARIHKLRNHWHDAKKHRCAECAETFLLPIELRKHVQKKHYGSAVYQHMMDAAKLEPGEVLPVMASESSIHGIAVSSADGTAPAVAVSD